MHGETRALLNVYLFSRNPTHNSLTFIEKSVTIPGNFTVDNTVCAQKENFFLPGNPLQSFHVIELADLELQTDIVLSHVPEAAEFVVFDRKQNPTWYFWSNRRMSMLSNASEYENKKASLSHVCYISEDLIPFVSFPDGPTLKIMRYIVFGFACAGAFFSLFPMLWYLCTVFKRDHRHLSFEKRFLTILSILNTVFCVNAVIGFLADSSASLANVSLITSWSSAITIAILLVYSIIGDVESSEDDNQPNPGTWQDIKKIKKKTFGNGEKKYLIYLLIWIMLVVAIMCLVFLLLAGTTGPDETSPYTLHYYAASLSKSFDTTWKNALIM